MASDQEFKNYHSYLLQRSWKSLVYRKVALYPRFKKFLNGAVLDVGCGIGDFLKFHPTAIGLDVNPYNVAYCKAQGMTCQVLNPPVYPFADLSFQTVLLDNVLEHLEEPKSTLLEISRILDHKGLFIVGVPGTKGYACDSDHKVFYDESSLSELMKMYGFALKKFFYAPFKSKFLNKHMSQYCLYGVFEKQ